MDIEELWQRAVDKTEILRGRLRLLLTFAPTVLPYIYLAESAVNISDVVVRKGKVIVEKPLLILPGNLAQLEGFQIDASGFQLSNDAVATFLLMRGVSFPTMKYSNETHKLEVVPGPLSKVISEYKKDLQKKEDIATGLIVSPEDCWQFSILIYISMQVSKSIPEDIRNIIRRMEIENN